MKIDLECYSTAYENIMRIENHEPEMIKGNYQIINKVNYSSDADIYQKISESADIASTLQGSDTLSNKTTGYWYQEMVAMQSTLSWRITKPLRIIRKLMK